MTLVCQKNAKKKHSIFQYLYDRSRNLTFDAKGLCIVWVVKDLCFCVVLTALPKLATSV